MHSGAGMSPTAMLMTMSRNAEPMASDWLDVGRSLTASGRIKSFACARTAESHSQMTTPAGPQSDRSSRSAAPDCSGRLRLASRPVPPQKGLLFCARANGTVHRCAPLQRPHVASVRLQAGLYELRTYVGQSNLFNSLAGVERAVAELLGSIS
jgi:hypothetical protein